MYISNIHTCTISFIIYTPSNSECNKFLPPLHFLYIVDNMKDRCDPRSFTVVIFGRQEKKKKQRYVLFSVQQRFSLSRMNIGVTACTICARMSTPRAISFIFTITFVGNKHNRFRNRIELKTERFRSGKIRREILRGGIESFRKQAKKEKERERDGKEKKNKRKSERSFTEHFFKSFLLYEFLKNQFKHVRISKNYNYNYRKIKRVSSYVVVCTPCRSSDVEVRWYT